MTQLPMDPPPPDDALAGGPPQAGVTAWPADTGWRRLPPAARLLFLLDTGLGFAIAGLVAGGLAGLVASSLLDAPSTLLVVVGGALSGLVPLALWGIWLALRQYQRTAWRLDDKGLSVRRGRLWWSETRVPATRVQHLDIQRGPLQRRRDVSTLVVHTAGTTSSAVTVPHMDAGDAEHLRERLSRRIEDDDDA